MHGSNAAQISAYVNVCSSLAISHAIVLSPMTNSLAWPYQLLIWLLHRHIAPGCTEQCSQHREEQGCSSVVVLNSAHILQVNKFFVTDCICSAFGLDSLCLIALVSAVIGGQLMSADGAGVLLGKPGCQTRCMEGMS